jgi:threonine dehydratase
MTRTLERAPSVGDDEALERMEKHLGNLEQRLQFEELDREFAFYMMRLGTTGLYLADATVNPAGTFKVRGALNKMSKVKSSGGDIVSVASQGSHLLASIYAGTLLDMNIHGYVPFDTTPQKIQKARAMQPDTSRFVLHQDESTLEDSLATAQAEGPGAFVHPFNDLDVIEGARTIAYDIAASAEANGVALQHVVVPVGGGGLLAATASGFHEIDPNITVHGVEAEGSDSMSRSIDAGQHIEATNPNHRYRGSRVKLTGALTLELCSNLPNIRHWSVTDKEVRWLVEEHLDEKQQRDLHHDPLEPTSLVAVAGLRQIVRQYPGEAIAVVGTGRNAPLSDVWS